MIDSCDWLVIVKELWLQMTSSAQNGSIRNIREIIGLHSWKVGGSEDVSIFVYSVGTSHHSGRMLTPGLNRVICGF